MHKWRETYQQVSLPPVQTSKKFRPVFIMTNPTTSAKPIEFYCDSAAAQSLSQTYGSHLEKMTLGLAKSLRSALSEISRVELINFNDYSDELHPHLKLAQSDRTQIDPLITAVSEQIRLGSWEVQ